MKCGAKQFFYNHLILQNINLKGDIILVMLQLSVNLQLVLQLFDSNIIFLQFKQVLCKQLPGMYDQTISIR